MKKNLNKKGFTLIELIVVIAILAILALILVPSITGYIAKAESAKNQANARSEYSRVVLEAWTTNGAPKTRTGGAIVTATDYALTTGTNPMMCNVTFTAGSPDISSFFCHIGADYWRQSSDFVATK